MPGRHQMTAVLRTATSDIMLTSETTPAGRRWVGTGETDLGRLMPRGRWFESPPAPGKHPREISGAVLCLPGKNGSKSSVTYRECDVLRLGSESSISCPMSCAAARFRPANISLGRAGRVPQHRILPDLAV